LFVSANGIGECGGEQIVVVNGQVRIDSHQHFWKYDPRRHTWITEAMGVLKRDFLPKDLGTELDRNGIDASIAVQASQSEDETRFLLHLAESNQRIAGVVGWIDLVSPTLGDRLEYFSQFEKLCGFRHIAQDELDDRFLIRDDFLRGISQLRQFGFTYDILIYPRQLPAAIDLVSRFSEQRFVVDHLAKPDLKTQERASWAAHMRSIACNPKLYCKLSGLVTEADWLLWTPADFTFYLDTVFEAFGPERLMFGSDWPVCLLAASYRKVKQVIEDYVDRNAPKEKHEIFGANAIRFYGLKTVNYGFAAQG
jgi:L-fuconolactonase